MVKQEKGCKKYGQEKYCIKQGFIDKCYNSILKKINDARGHDANNGGIYTSHNLLNPVELLDVFPEGIEKNNQ